MDIGLCLIVQLCNNFGCQKSVSIFCWLSCLEFQLNHIWGTRCPLFSPTLSRLFGHCWKTWLWFSYTHTHTWVWGIVISSKTQLTINVPHWHFSNEIVVFNLVNSSVPGNTWKWLHDPDLLIDAVPMLARKSEERYVASEHNNINVTLCHQTWQLFLWFTLTLFCYHLLLSSRIVSVYRLSEVVHIDSCFDRKWKWVAFGST